MVTLYSEILAVFYSTVSNWNIFFLINLKFQVKGKRGFLSLSYSVLLSLLIHDAYLPSQRENGTLNGE